SMKSKKPTLIAPMTLRTRASISGGTFRLYKVTAKVHRPRISVHKRSEPSCDPHVAANRYAIGNCEFELAATLRTEKSLLMNDQARHKNAVATRKNCARPAMTATLIHGEYRIVAPIMGNAN